MSLHKPLLLRRDESGRKVRGCVCGKPEGACVCARSEFWYCAFSFGGKQYQRNTGTTDLREARKFEARLLKGLRSERAAQVMAAMDAAMMVRRVCTIGEVLEAYESPRVMVIDGAVARRNAGSLLLVLAWARDLWTVDEKGVKRPDGARIRKLPASVLTKELVRDYQRARLGTEGIDFKEVVPGARTINSTLQKARDVFARSALMEKLGDLVLPDLAGFRGALLLPQGDGKPEPLTVAEFNRMCTEADGFLASEDEDLRRRGMMNLMLRQTGMRVGSLREMDGSWVRKMSGGWVCDLKDVKGGTEPYTIPVSDEFAAMVVKEGFDERGTPKRVLGSGWKALWIGHNRWLAGIIGGLGVKTQKAHRLRDTAGTVVKCWLGLPAAVELLGHANAGMTTKHYAKMQWEVSDRMRHELRACLRLVPTVFGQGAANTAEVSEVKAEPCAA